MFKLYASGGKSSGSAARTGGGAAGTRQGTVARVVNRARSAVSGVARRFFSGNQSGRA